MTTRKPNPVSPEQHATRRRSSRNRTKATTVYDEAKELLEAEQRQQAQELNEEEEEEDEVMSTDNEGPEEEEEEEEQEEVRKKPSPKKKKKLPVKSKKTEKIGSTAPKSRKVRGRVTNKRITKAMMDICKKCPEDSLLRQLITSHHQSESLVRDWMERYTSDTNAAIRQIFEFIFNSIGCFDDVFSKQGEEDDIPLAEMGEEEWQVLITDVVDTMRFTPPKLLYLRPIPCTSCEQRKFFAQVFTDIATFASTAVTSATQTARADEVVGQLCTLLAEISGVGQPDVRLAVSTAILSLGQGLLQHIKYVQKRLEDTRRQLSGANAGSSRHEALTSLIEKLQRDIDRSQSTLENIILNGVFLHRYRDSTAQIREVCIENLGVYIRELPDVFLENQWLKYLGWMLGDKDANVRLCSIRSITRLVPDDTENTNDPATDEFLVERSQTLQPFVTKFTARLIDLVLDVNGDVAEEALRCLIALLRCGLLDQMDEDSMWERVNLCALDDALSEEARRLALLFVLEQLEEFDEEIDKMSQANDKKNSKSLHSMACRRIDALASWVAHTLTDSSSDNQQEQANSVKVQYQLTKHVVNSILSLPKHSYLFSNPTYLISCLQREESAKSIDHNTANVGVDVVKSRILVQFLSMSLSEQRSGKDEDSYDTNSVLQSLPGLLKQYSADSVSMAQLCLIPGTLKHVWHLPGNAKYVASLMKEMSATFLRVGHSDVLQACSAGLHTLCINNTSLSLTKVIKECVSNVDDGDFLVRSRSLSRLGALCKQLNISTHVQDWKKIEKDLIDSLLLQIDDFHLDDRPMLESLQSGVQVLYSVLLWKVRDCILEEEDKFKDVDPQSQGDDSNDAEEVSDHIHQITNLRDGLVKLLDKLFTSLLGDEEIESNEELREQCLVFLVRISSDVRLLLPLSLKDLARSPSLRQVALSDSENLILIKHMTGVLRRYEDKLRSIPGSEIEAEAANALAQNFILPLVRPIVADWSYSNRKEAGILLSHIEHSGSTISAIVTEMSKQIKRENPVRLLEAHMACLRSQYSEWVDSEPSEPFTGPSQHPTDAEMEAFDQAEAAHRRQFGRLLELAAKLSSTLGVGRIQDTKLQKAIKLFLIEGIRYSFSHEENEDLVLGGRLSFLKILVKYATWIMPSRGNQASNKETRRELAESINASEEKLREHENFEDEVIPEDLEALDDFKEVLGMVSTTVPSKRVKRVPVTPTSHASSVEDRESMESSSQADVESQGSSGSFRSTLTGRYGRNRASIGSRSRMSMASTRTSISNLSPLQEEKSRSSGSTGTSSKSPTVVNPHGDDPVGRESYSTYASTGTRGTNASLKRYNKRKARNSQQSHVTQATYDGRATGSMSTHVEEEEERSVGTSSSDEIESKELFTSALKSKRTRR